MKLESRSRRRILVSGAMLLLVGLGGCVTQEEAKRQRDEAYNNGYKTGQLEERQKCNAEIESIKAEDQAKLEQAKTTHFWLGLGAGIIGGGLGVGLIVLVLAGAVAIARHLKRKEDSTPKNWAHQQPPPSVTAL